eukprot:m.151181 g.151181  ORF g.151181 m.151181 type:complete len:206 (+) comp38574_c0_seq16:2356-2973(+)
MALPCYTKALFEVLPLDNSSLKDSQSGLTDENEHDSTDERLPNISNYCFNRNDFEFDEENDYISKGGFGEVYRATLKQSGESIAIKIFTRAKRSKSESTMLRKEAIILLRIKPHPNILKSIGICDSPGCFALLMEYIDGGDLFELLTSSDQEIEKWQNRRDVSLQIASGMAHLHGHSPPIIHLDLKTKNVLIKINATEGVPFLYL